MEYKEVTFGAMQNGVKEIVIAMLSENGFEGFDESGDQLKAYIPAENFDEHIIREIGENFSVQTTLATLPDLNWNREWESNFSPVLVENFCMIRAPFHPANESVQHDIVITPKMSFGTGHHATTYMMLQQMREINMKGKAVLDFGTGTGVLAILAAQLGASSVLAVDNDRWSIENAAENIAANNCAGITLMQDNNAGNKGSFDVILANITRNVILENFGYFVDQLISPGTMVISGLLEEDEQHILPELAERKLAVLTKLQRDKWLSFKIKKE